MLRREIENRIVCLLGLQPPIVQAFRLEVYERVSGESIDRRAKSSHHWINSF
jgi:hypothetical protein